MSVPLVAGQWLASKYGSSEDDDKSVDVCSSDVFGESDWAESRRGVSRRTEAE